MEREARFGEMVAVLHALEARIERAGQQFRAQSNEGVLQRLAQYHSPAWRQRVIQAGLAICGDPRCAYSDAGLDADAYYYLQRFG